jgi:taurine dioxygenase
MVMHCALLHEAVGVEVKGLDLGAEVGAAEFEDLRDAVHDHGVVLCRGQDLLPTAQLALARRLGEPLPSYRPEYDLPGYPGLVRIGNLRQGGAPAAYLNTGGIEWHTDSPGSMRPPGYTILYCLESVIPDGGGETWFASTVTGYRTLPADLKSCLDGLELVHSFNVFNDRVATYDQSPVSRQQGALRTRNRDTRDPIVQGHPKTGDAHLYFARAMIKEIPGRDFDEGLALIQEVERAITHPDLVYRHAWQPGDLVIFDNRTCLHTPTPYAYDDYPRTRRLLHQVIIGARSG